MQKFRAMKGSLGTTSREKLANVRSEHVLKYCRQNKNKTEILVADPKKFRRMISDYYCCILIIPSIYCYATIH